MKESTVVGEVRGWVEIVLRQRALTQYSLASSLKEAKYMNVANHMTLSQDLSYLKVL